MGIPEVFSGPSPSPSSLVPRVVPEGPPEAAETNSEHRASNGGETIGIKFSSAPQIANTAIEKGKKKFPINMLKYEI